MLFASLTTLLLLVGGGKGLRVTTTLRGGNSGSCYTVLSYDFECLQVGVVGIDGYRSFYLIPGLSWMQVNSNFDCNSTAVGDVNYYALNTCVLDTPININGTVYSSVVCTQSECKFYESPDCFGDFLSFDTYTVYSIYISYKFGSSLLVKGGTSTYLDIFSQINCLGDYACEIQLSNGCTQANLALGSDVFPLISYATQERIVLSYTSFGFTNCEGRKEKKKDGRES